MVGPVSLLALWILSATPPGVAVSTDRQDSGVVGCGVSGSTLQGDQEGDGKSGPAPFAPDQSVCRPIRPTKPSSRRPRTRKGIPGLPPLPPQARGRKQAARPQLPRRRPRKNRPRASRNPSALPPPQETVRRPEPAAQPADAGETICTDEAQPILAATYAVLVSPNEPLAGWLDAYSAESWIDQGVTINTLSPRNRINGPVDTTTARTITNSIRCISGLRATCGGTATLGHGRAGRFPLRHRLELHGRPRIGGERRLYAAMERPTLRPGDAATLRRGLLPLGKRRHHETGALLLRLRLRDVTAPGNFFYSHSYLVPVCRTAHVHRSAGIDHLGDFTIQAGMTRG